MTVERPRRATARDAGLRPADIGVLGGFTAIGVTGVGLWMLRDLEALGGDARIFRALAHGLAIAFLTFGLPSIARHRLATPTSDIEGSPLASLSGLLLAALFGLALLGIALHLLAWSALPLTALIATIIFVLVTAEWWRGATLRERVAVPLLSGVLGASLGACFWGYGMQNPAFLTKAALSQYVTSYNPAIDTFFHASLINAIKNYGTASVGLDGLVPIPYHALTHVLFAGLSTLGGVSAIDFLNAASPVILLPLLPVSLVVFAASAARTWSTRPATDRPMLARWLTWVVLSAALVGFVPQPLATNFFLQWNLVIHSETYGLSVSLGLLWAAFLVTGLSERLVRDAAAMPQDYIVLAFAVLGLCLVSATKLSTGLVLLAGTCWLFLRLRLHRNPAAFAALVLAIAVVAFMASLGAPSSTRDAMQVVPLAFLRQFMGRDRVVPFVALFYIWPLSYLLFRAIREGSAGREDSVARRWRTGRILDLEFLGALVVAGMLPGLFFDLPPKGPQSATVNMYFMDIQMWFAAGLLLTLAATRGRDGVPSPAKAGRLTPAMLAVLSVAILAIGMLPNLLREFRSVSRQDAELRDLIREHPDGSGGPEARALVSLVALGDSQQGRQRRRAAVYVPQSNTAYWQLRVHGCEVVPFLALAIAGVAMIDGLPPAACKSPYLGYYGYQQYALRDETAAAAPISDARLCERAAKSGFHEVLKLDAFPVAEPRRLNCRD